MDSDYIQKYIDYIKKNNHDLHDKTIKNKIGRLRKLNIDVFMLSNEYNRNKLLFPKKISRNLKLFIEYFKIVDITKIKKLFDILEFLTCFELNKGRNFKILKDLYNNEYKKLMFIQRTYDARCDINFDKVIELKNKFFEKIKIKFVDPIANDKDNEKNYNYNGEFDPNSAEIPPEIWKNTWRSARNRKRPFRKLYCHYYWLCIYTEICPLRPQEFVNCKIVDIIPPENEWKDKNGKFIEFGYLSLNDKKMVSIYYKTDKIYGKKEIYISDDLINKIRYWIHFTDFIANSNIDLKACAKDQGNDKFQKAEYLITSMFGDKMDASNFANQFKENFKITSTGLRKSKCATIQETCIEENMQKLAYDMGHSIKTAHELYTNQLLPPKQYSIDQKNNFLTFVKNFK